jgi:hypothetical protein
MNEPAGYSGLLNFWALSIIWYSAITFWKVDVFLFSDESVEGTASVEFLRNSYLSHWLKCSLEYQMIKSKHSRIQSDIHHHQYLLELKTDLYLDLNKVSISIGRVYFTHSLSKV